jgi:hypothetical protein
MKNLAIIALSSLLLFSVSAGLSLWLKQSKEEAAQLADAKKDEKEKKAAAKDEHAKPVEKESPKPAAKVEHSSSSAATDELNAKRDKLEKLKQQFEIVQHDMRTQQDSLNKLMQQVAAESKAVKALADDAVNRATILKGEKESAEKALEKVNEKLSNDAKKPVEANDTANIEKMKAIVEKLEPEFAATMLQSMADKGNLDSVVRVLSKLDAKKAATIISAIKDQEFGNQLVSKILTSNTPKPGDTKK